VQILFFFNLANKFIENKLLIGLNNNSFMKNNLQNTKAYIDKKIDWPKIQSIMKVKFGNEIYESWIKKIDLVDEFKSYILLSVSTQTPVSPSIFLVFTPNLFVEDIIISSKNLT